MTNALNRILVLALVLAGGAAAEDMPEDAKKAIATFETKKRDIDAKAAAAAAKEREGLVKELNKAVERETKAHHSADALAIKDYLEQLQKTTVGAKKE
ncbi:MAG: hypothetical protein H0W83_03790 [Planctomycetes bacterium]|nr:hypothetical protein [Planctomycetota bacterium]